MDAAPRRAIFVMGDVVAVTDSHRLFRWSASRRTAIRGDGAVASVADPAWISTGFADEIDGGPTVARFGFSPRCQPAAMQAMARRQSTVTRCRTWFFVRGGLTVWAAPRRQRAPAIPRCGGETTV